MSARFLVVKAGTTVPALVPRRGDFEDWFRAGLAPHACDVVRAAEGEALPEPGAHAGVVVTGASAMVTDEAAWSLALEEWLARVARSGAAVLAVCYGHQLLARALGGEVGWNDNGREIGTVEVELTPVGVKDPLLAGLETPLRVQASHSQSVLVLPRGARRLAFNAHDEHQAFAWGERVWGLQFHPEFDADIVRGYVQERRADLEREGLDPERLLAAAADSPAGPEILARFARIAAGALVR